MIHGSKLAMHLAGRCEAIFRSMPAIGGPFMSAHRQGWPSALMALQQASLGEMGLNGETAALQGVSWTSAEMKVLPQGWHLPCSMKPVKTNTKTRSGRALVLKSFMLFSVTALLVTMHRPAYIRKSEKQVMTYCISVLTQNHIGHAIFVLNCF